MFDFIETSLSQMGEVATLEEIPGIETEVDLMILLSGMVGGISYSTTTCESL